MYRKIAIKFLNWWKQTQIYFTTLGSQLKLKDIAWRDSPEYLRYLRMQFRRSFPKRGLSLPERARDLIDQIAISTDLSLHDVLCVGVRNRSEIDYLVSKGAKSVTAIDLFSDDSAILVMDMHKMTFTDNQFDLVYCSHSFEHSYDPQKVANEIVRVSRSRASIVIEVPVDYPVRGADMIDFKNCSNLLSYFSGYLEKILWCKEKPAQHSPGQIANKTIRTMFSIRK